MTNEAIIVIMFIPIVILSYAIGCFRGRSETVQLLKERLKDE